MAVTKAVIPAAGLGTRFLPASKAVPKVLLPVVDRPAIQYAVEELVRAGIRNVCIVVSPGQEIVAEHFSPAPELEAALKRTGKSELLAEVRHTSELADVEFVVQQDALGLGHAVGVARDYVEGEPFAVVLPDEIVDPREDFVGEMIRAFDATGKNVIGVQKVPIEEISLYGSIDSADLEADLIEVRAIVEKPEAKAAPSNLAVRGRYVLGADVFGLIEKLEPGAIGEIQLTDALARYADQGRLLAKLFRGRLWDTGKKEGYLEATVSLAADREDLGPEFVRFLRDFLE